MCKRIGISEEKMINEIIECMSESVFEAFYNWIIGLEENGLSESTIRNYRPKVKACLISDIFKNRDINDITENDVEKYLLEFVSKDKPQTYQSRINYNKSFFDYACPDIAKEVDWKVLRLKIDELNADNAAQILDAKIIAACRDEMNDFSNTDKLRKRFIFEMMLHTELTSIDIGNVKYEDFQIEKIDGQERCVLQWKHENIILSHMVGLIIKEMKKKELFHFDTRTYVEQLKVELKKCGVENFKRSDLERTRKERFQICPQCGKRYEALPENWCLREFGERKELWIICRGCCNV